MDENKIKLDNGLFACVDWLSFTVLDSGFSCDNVIEFMGFDLSLFRNMQNGANGYKRGKKFENITVLYDGSENMGIHVNISGSSISTLLDAYKNVYTDGLYVKTPFGDGWYLWEDTVLSNFLSEVLKIGRLTRFDIAIDDIGSFYYSTDDIIAKQKGGKIISLWRSFQNNEESIISCNTKIGHTIYYGSMQSDIKLRIYDKQLERNKGLSMSDDMYVSNKWTRWELELRHERAINVARMLVSGMALGEVALSVLEHYFRIIVLDNNHKSRCSSEPMWLCFVNNVRGLKITTKKENKCLDYQIKQFEYQNGRKLAKIFYAKGGDVSYFSDLACRYECKLTAQDEEEIDEYFNVKGSMQC